MGSVSVVSLFGYDMLKTNVDIYFLPTFIVY